MITQVFLSGHLGREADLTPTPEDARWTTELCAKHNVTGLTIYSDGDFLSVLEGELNATMAVMKEIGQDPRIETAKIVLNEEKPAREFSQFSIGFRGVDYSDQNKQSFRLTSDSLAQRLPAKPSATLQSLTKVFARVHNLPNV